MLTKNNKRVKTTAVKSLPSYYIATKTPNNSDPFIPIFLTEDVYSYRSKRITNNKNIYIIAVNSLPSHYIVKNC